MNKKKLRKWAEKLTKGSLRIDRHCAKWLLTLQKPASRRGQTETITAKGPTLDSAGQRLFHQLGVDL